MPHQDAPSSKHILSWYALMHAQVVPAEDVAAWLAATKHPPRHLLVPLWTTVGANDDGRSFNSSASEVTLAIRRLTRADLRIDCWAPREEVVQIWRERRRELRFLLGVPDDALDETRRETASNAPSKSAPSAALVLSRIVEILDLSPQGAPDLPAQVEAYKQTHDSLKARAEQLARELWALREATAIDAPDLATISPDHVRQAIQSLADGQETAERQAVAGRVLARFALTPEGGDPARWITELRRLAGQVNSEPVLEDQSARLAIAEAARLRLSAAISRLGAPATGNGFSFPALATAFARLVDEFHEARREAEAAKAELNLARGARVVLTREFARALGMEDDASPTAVIHRVRKVAASALDALADRDDVVKVFGTIAARLGVTPEPPIVEAAICQLQRGAEKHGETPEVQGADPSPVARALAERDAEWAAAWDAPGAEPADLAAWVATVHAALAAKSAASSALGTIGALIASSARRSLDCLLRHLPRRRRSPG